MKFFRIPSLALTMAAALSLTSCALLPPHVVVVDPAGKPVAGAQVEPISASINYQPVLTDSKGRVRFGPAMLKREWFNVAKDGYAPHTFVNLTGPEPVRVVLTKTQPP